MPPAVLSLPVSPARVARLLPPAVLALLLALPWLWPWAPGPSVHVAPLLLSWACTVAAGVVWLLSGLARQQAPGVIAGAWLAAALASAVIGLLQWFGQVGDWAWVQPGALGEAYGNLRQRNQFASLMSIGLVALLCLHAQGARALRGPGWALAAAVLLGLGCAASLSRTGLVQFGLVGAVALLRPGSRRLVLAAWLAYAVGAVGLPPALTAWTGVDAPSLLGRLADDLGCSSRKVLWSNVAYLIVQKPWLGWGPGELDYAHYATLYPGPRFCAILDNAHNLPLHLAVEFGLPAALLVCAGVLGWLLACRPWNERKPLRVLAWGVLGVIALHSLLEYPLWYGPFQLAVALALVLLARRPMGDALEWSGTGAWAALLLACVAAGALVWAAACYQRTSQAYLAPEQRLPRYQADPLQDVRPGPFAGHAGFARLSLTPLHRASATQVHALSLELLHFSPEPRVIEAVIESATLLGRDEEAMWHLARYRAAFPAEHAAWKQPLLKPLIQN